MAENSVCTMTKALTETTQVGLHLPEQNTTKLSRNLPNIKDDVKYVAYFYESSGIKPTDIIFNIVKSSGRIYMLLLIYRA